MEAMLIFLFGVGAIGCVMAWLWFLVVAFRVNEGYGLGCMLIPIPVALVFLFEHWQKAKRPFFVQLAACVPLLLAFLIAPLLAPKNPSPEKLAAEVKPMILREWKKHPGLENATIKTISLTHKGRGHYSGFIEATLDGQPQRLLLEVMLDRETIKWEVKPQAN